MARLHTRPARHALAILMATVLGASLAVLGSTPSYAAYDSITVKDPKNDLEWGPDYKFPDVVSVTYQHVGTRKAATLRVVIQLRKDVRWEHFHGLEFDANKIEVLVPTSDDGNHHVTLRPPGGDNKVCKPCRITKSAKARRIVITIPFARLGKPSSISLGKLYVAQGIIVDKVAKPARPLY